MPHEPKRWWIASLLTALGLAAVSSSSLAQVPGNQGLVVRDGSLGGAPPGVVPPDIDSLGQFADYLIAPELGDRSGNNVFFSFERFDVGAGETATFTGPLDGPQSVENIISRVTGATRSRIEGRLRSIVPDADVYLFHPSGVVFEDGSELDVKGSFFLATADFLRFDNGEEFGIARSSPLPLLATANPTDFSFLDSNRAPLVFRGGDLNVAVRPDRPNDRSTVSLSGNDVVFQGAPTTIGSQGDSALEIVGMELVLIRSIVTTSAEILIRAPELRLRDGEIVNVSIGQDRTSLRADRMRMENAAIRNDQVIGNAPGGVQIGVTERLDLENSTISTQALLEGNSGDILIDAPEIRVSESGVLSTSASGSGAAGGILIRSSRIKINGPLQILSEARGAATAGTIAVDAKEIVIDGGATLSTSALGHEAGGSVTLSGDDSITIRNAVLESASLRSDGGGIVIEAKSVRLLANARVTTSSSGEGNGGGVSIRGNQVYLDGSSITSQGLGGGPGGEVRIDADGPIEIRRTAIEANALVGAGGNIEIRGGEIIVIDPEITASASGEDPGGNVGLIASAINLGDGTTVSVTGEGPGGAGTIEINAGQLATQGSAISSAAGQGGGGNVDIELGDTMHLVGTDVSASVTSGVGGNVTIQPSPDASRAGFVILEASSITADASTEGGFGGRIRITADAFLADTNSLVDASAPGGAEFAGTVEINAPDTDVTDEIAVLPTSLLDASALLSERCSARAPGDSSAFVVSGRDGVPPAPNGLLAAGSVAVANGVAGETPSRPPLASWRAGSHPAGLSTCN